jgi:hypothetical protein
MHERFFIFAQAALEVLFENSMAHGAIGEMSGAEGIG